MCFGETKKREHSPHGCTYVGWSSHRTLVHMFTHILPEKEMWWNSLFPDFSCQFVSAASNYLDLSVWHKVTPVTIWDNRYFKQPSVMTAPSLSISITNALLYMMSQTPKTQNELGTRNQTRHVDENYWRQNCAIWSTTRFAFKYLCKTYEILVYKIITAFNAAFSSVKLEKTKWYAMFSPSL